MNIILTAPGTRGGRADYDAWAALGNEGWGWDDLLPYFQKVYRDHISNTQLM